MARMFGIIPTRPVKTAGRRAIRSVCRSSPGARKRCRSKVCTTRPCWSSDMSDQTNNDNGNHIDGRTREGKAQREAQRAAFTARDDQREPTRGLARESDREPEREHRGGEQIVGRNGEVLSRKRKG